MPASTTVVSSGGSFHIEIRRTPTRPHLQADTGGVIAALGVSDKGNAIFSANIGGAANGSDDGSATVSGNQVTATDQTGANGLQVFYNGNTDLAGPTSTIRSVLARRSTSPSACSRPTG
jgi:hypothetical protein